MKGHKFLKITGILMIVSAAISILAGVFVGGLGALAAGLGAASGLTFSYWAALFLTLVGGICQLIAGVKGVKHCQRIEEAGKLIIWGSDCGSVLHSEHSPEHGQRRRIQFYEHLDRRSRSGSVHLRRSAEQQDRGRVCGIKKKKQNNEKETIFVCTPAVYRDRVGSIGSQQVGAFPKQFGREL